jgi:hypothetical protein
MLRAVAITRQKLAYWFFWAVFIAWVPAAAYVSLRGWRLRESGIPISWVVIVFPWIGPLGMLKLIAFIKHHRLHERAWLSSEPPGTQPPGMVS